MKLDAIVSYFRSKRDYLTFFLSLCLILVIPILTFSVFFTSFIGQRYTQKLFSLAEATCARTETYFQRTLYQCDRIAEMLAEKNALQIQEPGGSPQIWGQISQTLEQARVLNEALVEIVYQRDDSNVIFTTSQALYRAKGGPDSIQRLDEIPEKAGFYREAFIGSGPATTKAVIAYTVPIENGEGALSFWLDAGALLPTPVDADPSLSLMLWDNGILIWQNGEVQEESLSTARSTQGNFQLLDTPSGKYYLNRHTSSDYTATILFILPYEMVMQEADQLSRSFVIGVILEAVLCMGLILLLSRRNYRPIHQLYGSFLKFVPELMPIASTGELDAASYALQRLSHRDYDLRQQKEQAVQQKLLHRLFTGSLRRSDQLTRAGILVEGRRFGVVLFSLREHFPDEAFPPLLHELRLLLSEQGIVSYSTDYIENRSQLFLLELKENRTPAQLLEHPVRLLERKFGRIFLLQCGSPVEDFQKIWISYCDAMSARRPGEEEQLIYQYECPPLGDNLTMMYPQAELDGLYTAITGGNVERIYFLTDSLLGQLQTGRGFVSTGLSYDIAITFMRAVSALQPPPTEGVPDMSSWPPFQSEEDARQRLVLLRDQVIGLIRSRQTPPSDGFDRILHYINDNIDNPDLSVALIADAMEVSPAALGKLFHERTGTTISDYMGSLRHEHIRMLLHSTDLPVSEIARRMGYSQTSSFIRRFKSVEGITPGEYRSQRKGG